MKCPRDTTDLADVSGCPPGTLRCPQCSGVWFTKAARDQRWPDIVSQSIRRSPGSLLFSVDGKTLVTISFRQIELDLCGGCRGIWFDAHEIQAVIAERRLSANPLYAGAGSRHSDLASGSTVIDTLGETLGEAGIEFLGHIICRLPELLDR